MAIPWNDDPAGYERVIEANATRLIIDMVAAAPARTLPSISMAQRWHRALYAGVPLPVSYYAGEVRDSDPRFSELFGYEVRVGGSDGLNSSLVPGELARFESALQTTIAALDARIPLRAALDRARLMNILQVMAAVHGEWVRIHPFANGNGRTARAWANWIATRYGLEAFVQLKPRPASLLYAGAAAASMRGDHGPMVVVFHSMLRAYLQANSPPSP